MKLNNQKTLAGKVCGISRKRVRIDPERAEEIKESITKADIRGLIKDGAIRVLSKKGVSRARANKIMKQKSKGRRKGPGSLKGKKTARTPKKKVWMNKVRLQRKLLKELKEKKMLSQAGYWELYKKSKGGFFRSRRHLKLYIEEHKMVQNVKK